MHFAALLPFVAAIVPLATAQGSTKGVFISKSGEEFKIDTDDCVNFKSTQPIYEKLIVNAGNACTLYDSKDCEAYNAWEFLEGEHEVETLKFRSVQCVLD
ncbi:hypothetical protein V494_07612 [Pseudogymnoascus sp. VKM F-4513 (FW-928)]|nr:hypothetical protein V494_07612 [Pseudogymnoascus sp. VKM F-4513 (FW-928)]